MTTRYPGFTLRGWTATIDRPGPDDAGSIQRAHDTLAAMKRAELGRDYNARPRGVIRIPDGRYTVDRSVSIETGGIDVIGEGSGTWITSGFLDCRPLFTFGLPRIDRARAAAHRPASGGFATKGTARLVAVGSPLSAGRIAPDGCPDHFGSVRTLTIRLAIEPGPGGFPRGACLAGVGSWDASASPYLVGTPDPTDGPDGFRLRLATVDGAGERHEQQFNVPYGDGGAVVFAVDLDAGRVSASVGGRNAVEWPIEPGHSLVPNDAKPFMVADRGGRAPSFGAAPDFTLTLFEVEVDGVPLAHLDFGGPDPSEVAVVGGDAAGSRRCVAHLLVADQYGDRQLGQGPFSLRDARLTGCHPYGTAILAGWTGGLTIDGVTAEGGSFGYASLGAPAGSYTTRIARSLLSGADSAILSHREILDLDGARFARSGRVTVRTWGTKLDRFQDWFVYQITPDAESLLVGHGHADGGQWSVDYGNHNGENRPLGGPLISVEANPYATSRLTVRSLNGCKLGDAASIRLVNPPGCLGGVAVIDGLISTDNPPGRPTVLPDPGWSGSLAGIRSGGQPSARVDSATPHLWQLEPGSPIPATPTERTA